MSAAPPLPAPDARTSPRALWSLILGILGITCLWVLGAAPAIGLGILGLREVDRSGGSVKGRGLAIAGIITGAVGLVAGLVPVAILASLAVPAYTNVQEQATASRQAATVRSLLLACRAYADERDGSYPQALQELVEEGYLDSPTLLRWSDRPSDREGEPWLYRPGLTDTASPEEPLLAAPAPLRHERVVGFAGGHVVRMREEEFQATHAGAF